MLHVKKILLMMFLLISTLNASPFEKGSTNVGLSLGTGTSSFSRETNYYTIIGVSGGVFVMDGLNVGLGYRGWFGASPSINEVMIPVTYYLPLKKVQPYIGPFYQHTFIEGRDDYDSYGYRLGAAFNASRNSYGAIGFVHEFYSTGGDNIYPEILFGVSF